MQVFEKGLEARAAILTAQREGESIGLVPTMGALHQGHMSLIDAAREECDRVVASIFVNPAQFAAGEDLEKYPRALEQDLQLLEDRGCWMAFTPSIEEMYPAGYATTVHMGGVAERLEGAARPGHFDGVATVVLKLLHLLPAGRAYFGQKDYQQSLVVRQMVEDLNVSVKLNICPIVREEDGLAMSSRNAYLSQEERLQALALFESLNAAKSAYQAGERNGDAIRKIMQDRLDAAKGVEPEYVALVAEGTVEPVETLSEPAVALAAARVGKTRLIDNCRIG